MPFCVNFAQGMEGSHSNVQVRHLLSDLVQVARRTLPKSIETQADLAPDLWMVQADATQHSSQA
jgi:hypothetical protein